MKFQEKIVIITGSSSGIGKAIALRFARENTKIAVNFKSNSSGAKVQERLLIRLPFEE
ncbi:MAG: SDR family NAD(P)-dependent oxidoreductase [Symplocastrum torsivum CPER-KK1]|jgi:NAD(P)-dependent dehydrogenase (short-subunit alcohol dehydrogenase family)|uniref:SDR family NAD(P)-dependent oxidoreductase n=1 Tax=Symplocastrum torsivum CPER-KK1 TaxID=450513 RepID=A0A951UDN1_9CYAN|nr:SDR family NAD(P)-dependent oxidoreductase [Symplocastrum torsivum CPER-KK1]